jgi:hypothetical protein
MATLHRGSKMTEVYSAELGKVVATGDPYVKVGHHYEVRNCLPLNGPQVNDKYTLREDKRPQIYVECIQQGQPGIQTALFKEI